MGEQRRPSIGIVVKTYPKLSETFILEELLGLEQRGLRLQIFSLQHPTDDRANRETADVQAPVHYRPRALALVADHARVAVRHPLRYLRALLSTARGGDDDRMTSFATAGWLAAEAGRQGLVHLHAHFVSEPASAAEIAAPMSGLRFSISAHAKDIYLSPPASVARKLRAARFTVTCTEHNRAHLARLGGPGAAVERVHHGVQLDRFTPSCPRPGRPVILGVGRLRAKKGFDLLVDACAELVAAGRDLECRIVGYGPEEGALRDQIDRLGLGDRVHLYDKCTRDEVIQHYREATMVVQPCRVTPDGDRDGIPNVLLEAMAMALPVVSTPVSGIPELVRSGDNGVLVDEGDSHGLAAAMAALLDDRRLRRILGSRARATVETSFSVEQSARRIAAKLDQPRVAYVVKGYPRLSELFIATEIHRVEQLELPLRLFVLKQADEEVRHQIVRETEAEPEHLPALTSISGQPVLPWLARNLGPYRTALTRTALAAPVGFTTAAGHAVAQSWRARKGRWPRKVYLKEFLQAAAIAEQLLDDPAIRHLHAHFCHGSTTVAWLAATISGRTFSFTAHAKDIYRSDLNPAGLLNRKLQAAEFATTCTDANRAHLQELEPAAAVHTVYHGLNEEFARLLGPQRGPSLAPGVPFTVMSVARLVPKKGLDLLIEATAELVESGLDVCVRIAGEDGEHGSTLRRLVAERGLGDRVSFVGPVDQRGLLRELRRADAFCLPCRVLADGDRDGIPNVLIEAMAAGVPVVSTPISGIPELIENRHNGLLVSPESSTAVAKALLELHDDPDLGLRLTAAGQETVDGRFDGWATTRDLVSHFESVVG